MQTVSVSLLTSSSNRPNHTRKAACLSFKNNAENQPRAFFASAAFFLLVSPSVLRSIPVCDLRTRAEDFLNPGLRPPNLRRRFPQSRPATSEPALKISSIPACNLRTRADGFPQSRLTTSEPALKISSIPVCDLRTCAEDFLNPGLRPPDLR